MLEMVLKSFENPDETRVFEKGKLDIVRIGGMRSAAQVTNLAGNGLNT